MDRPRPDPLRLRMIGIIVTALILLGLALYAIALALSAPGAGDGHLRGVLLVGRHERELSKAPARSGGPGHRRAGSGARRGRLRTLRHGCSGRSRAAGCRRPDIGPAACSTSRSASGSGPVLPSSRGTPSTSSAVAILSASPAVGDDPDRDEGGGDRIGPPPAEPEADHSGEAGGAGLPVGLVHLRIGEQHLVLHLAGERHLLAGR